jgi:CheY-like chemotaxis protein
MPDYDGFTLTELILGTKENWKFALMNSHKYGKHKSMTPTKVIAVTAFTDKETVVRAKHSGILEVLNKPIT